MSFLIVVFILRFIIKLRFPESASNSLSDCTELVTVELSFQIVSVSCER